jgi:hypothetical protein
MECRTADSSRCRNFAYWYAEFFDKLSAVSWFHFAVANIYRRKTSGIEITAVLSLRWTCAGLCLLPD